MKRKIFWSQTASEDLSDIVFYIKEHSGLNIARQIYSCIKEKVERASEFPESGRVVPELSLIGVQDIRELVEKPWRIFYRADETMIQVLSVIDGRRNVEELLYKKMIDVKMK